MDFFLYEKRKFYTLSKTQYFKEDLFMISKSAAIVPVLSGINASMRTGIEAKQLGITKALVVYDLGVYNAGIVEPVIESLKASRIEVVKFDKVTPDPPDIMINEGGELAVKENVDGIIAIGGGSVMDTAKGINILCKNPAPINQWFFPIEPQGDPLPMIALPTTAGTGSEGSFAAVVTETSTGIKGALLDLNFCKFSLTVQDPKMYAGLPTKPTVYCAFDVLTHSIDALMSQFNEQYSVMFAEHAIRKVIKYLPRVKENGNDLEARGEIAFAATLGGNILNTNMAGHTHVIGHSIGAICHIPHGLAVSLPLASLIELYYCKWNPERVKMIGELFGLEFNGSETPEEIGKITGGRIIEYIKELGIETLSELNLKKEDIDKAVGIMTSDIQFPTAAVLLSESQFRAVVDHMYSL